MVRSSGIREKLRSNVLKELARERGTKQPRVEVAKPLDEEEDEEEEQARLEQERMLAKARCSKNSLLSILPRPKNSSAFGPTIKLDKLLKMPERADKQSADGHNIQDDEPSSIAGRELTDDGMIEVNVSKFVGDVSHTLVRELTLEKVKPGAVIVPKGKERQKNQITYLAQLGKATELERKEQAAQSRINKAVARSKYGW